MYHSSATLYMCMARVLVGANNPHSGYVFTNVTYPDIAEPAGVPAPLPGRAAQPLDSIRPRALTAPAQVGHGETKEVRFEVPGGALAGGGPEE